jgi:hypothetical protein
MNSMQIDIGFGSFHILYKSIQYVLRYVWLIVMVIGLNLIVRGESCFSDVRALYWLDIDVSNTFVENIHIYIDKLW